MAEIEVREIRTDEHPAWNAMVAESPLGTVFHSSDWITTCAGLLGQHPLLLGAFEDGRLAGGCSSYVTEKAGIVSFCKSIAPTTPFGGYVLERSAGTKVRETEAQNRAIVSALSDDLAGRGFAQVNIVSAPAFHDIRALTWNEWTSSVYYTYMLRLVRDLFAAISKKARTTVRKGEKSGIRIRRAYDPELFWDLNLSTYERQDRGPLYTKAFLMGMLDLIARKNLGEMWIAETATGEPASAEVVIWDAQMAHRWSAASSPAHRSTGATTLLLFEILESLRERGFGVVNLMAGNVPRFSTFVASFNPELIPYYGVEKTWVISDAARLSKRLLKELKPR